MASGGVAVAPECHRCLGIKGLQTPFTWYSPVITVPSCHETDDKLCLLGTPWAVLLNRLHSAYSYFSNGHFEAGRSRLVVCFMQLLPARVDDCEIVAKHREALRHVLDATWAAMVQLETMRQNGGLHIHRENLDWKDFTSAITPYRQMDRRQRAAICAIRGTLAREPRYLREAIKLNPTEGEWLYKLGYTLAEDVRGPFGGQPTSEEITMLRKGYRLRPNVDSMVRLARSLADTGRKGLEEAVALMEEALVLYPNHPRALFQCGIYLGGMQEDLGKAAGERVSSVELLERCVAAVDGKCAYVLFQLGKHYIYPKSPADKYKSTDYFDLALRVDRVAVDCYQQELVKFAKAFKKEQDLKEARASRKAC